MTRAVRASCPICGVRTPWKPAGWIVNETHDADGRVCQCCGGRRVNVLQYMREDGSTEVVKEWRRGVFVPRNGRLADVFSDLLRAEAVDG